MADNLDSDSHTSPEQSNDKPSSPEKSKKILGLEIKDFLDVIFKTLGLVTVFVGVLNYCQTQNSANALKAKEINAAKAEADRQAKADEKDKRDNLITSRSQARLDSELLLKQKELVLKQLEFTNTQLSNEKNLSFQREEAQKRYFADLERDKSQQSFELSKENVRRQAELYLETYVKLNELKETPFGTKEYYTKSKGLNSELYPKLVLIADTSVLNNYLTLKSTIDAINEIKPLRDRIEITLRDVEELDRSLHSRGFGFGKHDFLNHYKIFYYKNLVIKADSNFALLFSKTYSTIILLNSDQYNNNTYNPVSKELLSTYPIFKDQISNLNSRIMSFQNIYGFIKDILVDAYNDFDRMGYYKSEDKYRLTEPKKRPTLPPEVEKALEEYFAAYAKRIEYVYNLNYTSTIEFLRNLRESLLSAENKLQSKSEQYFSRLRVSMNDSNAILKTKLKP